MKKILIILFIVLLTVPVLGSLAQALPELETQLQELQQQQQQLEKEAQEVQKNLTQKRQEADTLAHRVEALEFEISSLEIKVQKTQNQIQSTLLKIKSLRLQTQTTALQIKGRLGDLKTFFKAIYLTDQVSPLEIFFTSETFGEFFKNRQYLRNLEERLGHLLKSLKARKADLENLQKRQLKQAQQLEALNRRLTAEQFAIRQQKQAKIQILSQTRGEEKRFQEILSDIEIKRARVLTEVRKLEKEISQLRNFIKFSQAKRIPRPGTKLLKMPLDNATFTQKYGMTAFAKRGVYGGAPHNGIDMTAGAGSPIKAAADGVIFASGTNPAWGNWVAIQHLDGLVSLYAHMLKPTHLALYKKVTQGETIGFEGSTGFSTGSHLHFSLYYKFFTFEKKRAIWFNYFEGTLNPLNYL
jgi:murein DD-endopeptidase MepM/ murein hydrolase activator NlpD